MEFSALFQTPQNLPSVPKVVHELLASFNREDVGIDEIIAHLRNDQALCAKLLRTANSAQFGSPRQVGSLDDAVMLLGFNNLRTIVIGCGLAGSARPVRGLDLNAFWRYSAQCAAASRWVAGRCRQDAAVGFTIGMMHAIGQLVMHMAMPGPMESLATDHPCHDASRAARERERFGYDYHAVGAELAGRWHFPDEFVAAVREAESPSASNRMACVLHLGAWAVRQDQARVAPAERQRWLPRMAMLPLQLGDEVLVDEMPPLDELTEGLQALTA